MLQDMKKVTKSSETYEYYIEEGKKRRIEVEKDWKQMEGRGRRGKFLGTEGRTGGREGKGGKCFGGTTEGRIGEGKRGK
jgi:hypothetical protein